MCVIGISYNVIMLGSNYNEITILSIEYKIQSNRWYLLDCIFNNRRALEDISIRVGQWNLMFIEMLFFTKDYFLFPFELHYHTFIRPKTQVFFESELWIVPFMYLYSSLPHWVQSNRYFKLYNTYNYIDIKVYIVNGFFSMYV